MPDSCSATLCHRLASTGGHGYCQVHHRANLIQFFKDGLKPCAGCGAVIAISDYRLVTRGGETLRPSNKCRECEREKSRRYRKDHPEVGRRWMAMNREARGYHRLYKYGVTVDDLNRMLAEQGGACAICRLPIPTSPEICVDHDHNSGKVRGLLCHACNIGLGKFGDDLARVRAAADYLTAHSSQEVTLGFE